MQKLYRKNSNSTNPVSVWKHFETKRDKGHERDGAANS